jgi:nucleoside-diphosphate-sugar epimerase
MPTALVTGASGFTGHYMVEALKSKGFTVVGLGSSHTQLDKLIPCDLTDKAAILSVVTDVKPDWVIHLAALSFVGHKDEEAFYKVNVFGTLNLLSALATLDTPPKRILVASSANVYGVPDVDLITENTAPNPVNHYACSKLTMEHMVATWFPRLPIIITRPFNYIGIGQSESFLIPKIVKHFALNKSAIELGNLNVSRDFTDVRDVIKAYMLLLESDASSVRVNVCSGTAVSLQHIIDTTAQIAGYQINVNVNPDFIRANEIPVLKGDNTLLKNITEWEPEYNLATTLESIYTTYNKGNLS